MISFEEFKKLDLRIGRIATVENHPNADKLYVLKVDMGGEERQLVAGLRPYYSADELQGKLITVAVNLEPAAIRGVESQGMLLAASDGPMVSCLQPDKDVAPGSEVM